MNTKLHSIKSLFIFVASLVITASLQAQSVEYEVKAAFLYNFAKFVIWPENPAGSNNHLTLCVIGTDPFGSILDNLQGKEVREQPLHIQRIAMPEESSGCHILFVSRSEENQLEKLFSLLEQKRGLLTISDINNFSSKGGMIELLVDGNKVRFAINVAAVRDAGLDMSSKLLQLATRIEGIN